MDHHKRAPYANLFTNIDVGKGGRIWSSSGGGSLGKHGAGWGTFWNIRAEQSIKAPSSHFGPWSINFIGLKSNEKTQTKELGRWWEAIDPEKLLAKEYP